MNILKELENYINLVSANFTSEPNKYLFGKSRNGIFFNDIGGIKLNKNIYEAENSIIRKISDYLGKKIKLMYPIKYLVKKSLSVFENLQFRFSLRGRKKAVQQNQLRIN